MVVLVSKQQMPASITFDEGGASSQFIDSEDGSIITNGSVVRLKIVGVRTDATGMFAVGTIKGDYLGVHEEDV
jgi:DNA-directed RNA polymerase II subunit RPB7